MMTADEMIKDMPIGLLRWYEFKAESKILCIAENENFTEYLQGCNMQVTFIKVQKFLNDYTSLMKLSEVIQEADFDYVFIMNLLEQIEDPQILLTDLKCVLKKDGRLLIGMDNRLGLRYFCGDTDPFTNHSFDSVEHYRNIMQGDQITGHNYSKYEMECMLEDSGWKRKYYSVLPNLEFPQLVYAQDYLPVEELATRYFPVYNNPDTIFLEEEFLYTDFIQNGLFPATANSFFIECSKDNRFLNIDQVTLALDRGKEDSQMTKIYQDGNVVKSAVYKDGVSRLKRLVENAENLRKHGINVIDGHMVNDTYVMPYLKAETAVTYFQRLIYQDKEKFISEVDRFTQLLIHSSEQEQMEFENRMEICLKHGYIDLVPLNCFFLNNEFVFYDQEFYIEDLPVNVLLLRAINIIYTDRIKMEAVLPREYFFKRYGLLERLELWNQKSNEFTSKLRNQKELRIFNEKYRRDPDVVNTNRQRMNYSASDYQKTFIDIFQNLEQKKLFLFGSGNFTKKFLKLFGNRYPVTMILDNNPESWGRELEGIQIASPDILHELNPNDYKVIICIKRYPAVMNQLKRFGVKYVGVYDAYIDYPMEPENQYKANEISPAEEEKRYHIGYIAGVFDLFHIGHLNMFKRAKEQCEYLIVGVVTDEGVRKFKKTDPFIPFKERMEIVGSCKYVDKAVEIPFNYGGTRDAYRMYHFDVQFSGSDYINDPNWIADKMFLEKQGAELVFFPYTEGTSSTQLKAALNKTIKE